MTALDYVVLDELRTLQDGNRHLEWDGQRVHTLPIREDGSLRFSGIAGCSALAVHLDQIGRYRNQGAGRIQRVYERLLRDGLAYQMEARRPLELDEHLVHPDAQRLMPNPENVFVSAFGVILLDSSRRPPLSTE